MPGPYIVATCGGSQSPVDSFDTGWTLVPAWGNSPEAVGVDASCGVPGQWRSIPLYYSEIQSWDLVYRPPYWLKEGLWTLTISVHKRAIGTIPDPAPDPLYNCYITAYDTYGCDKSQWIVATGWSHQFIQESVAGDGSDAVDFADYEVEGIGLWSAGTCCDAPILFHFAAGPSNSDGTPAQYWGWDVRIQAVWASDFPP